MLPSKGISLPSRRTQRTSLNCTPYCLMVPPSRPSACTEKRSREKLHASGSVTLRASLTLSRLYGGIAPFTWTSTAYRIRSTLKQFLYNLVSTQIYRYARLGRVGERSHQEIHAAFFNFFLFLFPTHTVLRIPRWRGAQRHVTARICSSFHRSKYFLPVLTCAHSCR